MDLTIVIPVLNEEQSVAKVAHDCLDAGEELVARQLVDQVNVVVVSDGSTDGTATIARAIEGVTTVVFEQNQGYGAAIQRGWQEKPAALLAFLDGDGTCDAHFFGPLIEALLREDAEVALGSRMGEDSRMPRLRRVGNWLFALLLGLLSRANISDSASGMRVLRSRALRGLLPLPHGLHFTPAMSARALFSSMKVVEVPMPYAERIGRSKLSVLKDGVRFLSVILSAALYIRPSRLTLPLIGLLLLASCALGAMPVVYYLHHHLLEEWMIYRFLSISLLADAGVLLFCATLIAEHVIALGLLRYGSYVQTTPWWWSMRGLRIYTGVAFALTLLGICLVLPGLRSWFATGTISFQQMHWSRVIVAAFGGMTLLQFMVTRGLLSLLAAIDARQGFLVGESRADEPMTAASLMPNRGT